jgi:hypothetical protein
MRRRFAIGLLAATAVAAGFMLPAQASGRSTHVARAYAVKGIARNAGSVGSVAATPQHVNIAWTPAAALPVAVALTGGGAGAGNSFYVPGGYKSFATPPTLNNTVQVYKKMTNTWVNDIANPIPPVSGLTPGLAEAGICWDPVGKMMHVIDGVAFDSSGNGFLIAEHLVYNPAAPTGSRWTFLSFPVDSTGNIWYGQDPGCGFIGGKMYLYGGYGVISPSQPSAVVENVTWVYDPATDTWSDTGKLMMHPRLWMGYTSNSTNAFAAGGTDNAITQVPLASTEKFTPATGWAATGNLPTALLGVGEGNVSTHLVVWGGQNASHVTQNKTYGCTLPGCATFSTTAFNVPSAKSFSAFGSGTSLYNAGGQTGTFVPVTTAEHLP